MGEIYIYIWKAIIIESIMELQKLYMSETVLQNKLIQDIQVYIYAIYILCCFSVSLGYWWLLRRHGWRSIVICWNHGWFFQKTVHRSFNPIYKLLAIFLAFTLPLSKVSLGISLQHPFSSKIPLLVPAATPHSETQSCCWVWHMMEL